MNPHLNYIHRPAPPRRATARRRTSAPRGRGVRRATQIARPRSDRSGERPPRATSAHGMTTLEIEPAIRSKR